MLQKEAGLRRRASLGPAACLASPPLPGPGRLGGAAAAEGLGSAATPRAGAIAPPLDDQDHLGRAASEPGPRFPPLRRQGGNDNCLT